MKAMNNNTPRTQQHTYGLKLTTLLALLVLLSMPQAQAQETVRDRKATRSGSVNVQTLERSSHREMTGGKIPADDLSASNAATSDDGSGNPSGGSQEGEEDVVIVHDGYQSVGEDDVRSREAALEAAERLPAQATLLGNYPNPFNPATTVRFELAEAQPVRLTVYNAIGQEVQVLVEGRLGSGRHEVRFEARNLASGLYLARLETPDGVSVQRMMLAK